VAQVHQRVFVSLASLFVLLGCTVVRADDSAAEKTLAENGLKIVGSLAVTETEGQIKTKLTEARRLSRQLNAAIMQQKGTMSPKERQDTINNINGQMGQLKNEMNAVGQQMNQLSRFRGRSFNSNAQQQFAQLQAYRSQLQYELNQESDFLGQLKNQTADPKAKDKIDAEVTDKREAYHQALVDLRTLADDTTQKYQDLAQSDAVKKAIESLGKGKHDKPKLGPSHDFHANVKLLEKLEKAETAAEVDPFAAKSSRRSGKAAKASRSLPAAKASSNSSGADN
jgi:hypothetical protein